jgi:hypothetical protein
MARSSWLALLTVACGTPDAALDGGSPERDAAATDAGPPPRDLPAFCADYPPAAPGAQSAWVHYGDDGLLVYASDDDGHRLPDLGHAGYRAGAEDPPELPEVARVAPGDGDDTARVQDALDGAAVPGAVVLAPGVYEIAGTLRVNRAGLVLRGSGDGDDPAVDTILRAPGDSPHQRSVIVVGGGALDWRDAIDGSQVEVTTPRVPVGAAWFEVDEPSRLAVGDRVIVRHPSTQAWIDALGGGGAEIPWSPGSQDIVYLRRVVAIDGARVTLDVPVHNHLDRALAQTVVYAVDDSGLVRDVGVERLRVDIVTAGGEDENHAWNAIDVVGAEDAWVTDVTALHFGYAAVRVRSSNRVTVRDAVALEPVAQVTGGRLYHFSADGFAQEVLFVDCEAHQARHGFVSNGTSTVSGIVFLRGRSIRTRGTMEGHRRWSQALLYDSIVEEQPATSNVVGLYNRGDWGTQHGWAAAHSVIWRHDTGGRRALLQQPPTAQNWAIGVTGTVSADGPFDGPPGLVEPIDGDLTPRSLYEAQVCDRLRR